MHHAILELSTQFPIHILHFHLLTNYKPYKKTYELYTTYKPYSYEPYRTYTVNILKRSQVWAKEELELLVEWMEENKKSFDKLDGMVSCIHSVPNME